MGKHLHLSDPISVNNYHDKVTYKHSLSPFKNVFILKSQQHYTATLTHSLTDSPIEKKFRHFPLS